MGIRKKLSGLLVIIVCGLMALFWVLNLNISFEPPYLMAALNTLFIGVANLLVSFLSARSYLKTGYKSAVLMSAATMIMGLGATFSGWMRYIPQGMNVYATVFNTNALIAALLHLAAAILEGSDEISAPVRLKGTLVKLGLAHVAAIAFTVFVTVGAVYGFILPFYAEGSFTFLRDAVVFIACTVHLSASMLFIKSYQLSRSDHLFWYSLSMLMFSFGLLGSSLERLPGGLVDWFGRLAQYGSGVFSFLCVWELFRDAKQRGMGLREAVSRIFLQTPPLYRSVLETCSDAIVLVDQDFRVLYVNKAAERMFALRKKQAVGAAFHAHIEEADRQRLLDDITVFMKTGTSRLSGDKTEITAKDSGGRAFPADISVSIYALPPGCVCTYIIHDITIRKRSQARAERQRTVLLAINRIYDKAVFCDSAEELGRACLAVVEEVTGSRASFMAELSDNGRLRETAISDASETLCTMADRRIRPRHVEGYSLHGLYGSVVRDGKTLLTNSPVSHADSCGVPEGHLPLTAFLGVPLFREGKAVGLIAAANREGGYRQEDRKMLETLAPTILEVCQRKKAEISARHTAFERTVLALSQEFINTPLDRLDSALNKAMEQVALYCGAERSSIYFYDWGEEVIRRQYGWDSVKDRPAGEKSDVIPFSGIPDIIERHIKGEPHFVKTIEDTPAHSPYRRTMQARKTSATANFPLVVEGKVLGTLSLSTARKQMNWTEDQLTAVEIFCQMIANVLTRKERETAIRQARKREEHHFEFERTILNLAQDYINTPLSQYRESIVKALGVVGEKTGADRVTIYRYDWEQGVARPVYKWDRQPGDFGEDGFAAIPMDKLKAFIERNGQRVAFIRSATEPLHVKGDPDEAAEHWGCVSGIVFPLVRNGSLYGTVGIAAQTDKLNYGLNEPLLRIFSQLMSNMLQRIDFMLELQVANETNRMILDSTYDGVAMFDREGIVLSAGRVFAAQFGKRPEEMVGTRMQEHYTAEQYGGSAQRQQKINNVFATGIAEFYEDCRDGLCLDTRICPVFKNGEVVAVTMFFTDITAKKKADEEARLITRLEREAELLQQKEKDYLEILDGSTDGSWIYDIQRGTIQYSVQWMKRIGAERIPYSQRLGYTDSVTHPDDREMVLAKREYAIENRLSKFKVEYRIRMADGHYIWVLGQNKILYNEEGLPLKIYGTTMDITDRKKAEEALREHELLMRTFMDSASDFMFIKDREGRVVMINEAYGKAFGLSARDMIGKNDFELYGDDELAREVTENDRLVMETGRMLVCQESMTTINGYRTYSLSKVPWRDTNGNILGVLGTAHDITELKNARDALQETVKSLRHSNECIELLYETTEKILSSATPRRDTKAPCAKVMRFLNCDVFCNYLVEGDQPVLYLNACVGVSDEQRRNITPLAFGAGVCGRVAQTGRRIVAEHIQSSTEESLVFLKQIGVRAYACHPLLADGKTIGTLSFGTRTADSFSEEELALMKSVADSIAVAVKRISAEEALRQSEELLRAIIDGANDPVFLKDRESRILMANEAMAVTTGVPVAGMMGKPAIEYYKDAECARINMENDRRVMENDVAEVVEEKVFSGKKMRTFLCSKTPWHDEQGKVIGLIGVARDITDRIVMEQELRQAARELAEKNALITDFFINISHEFKTPISVLQLAMEIMSEHMKRGSLDGEKLQKNLNTMMQNTCRLSKLVGNLLDITKIDAGFLQPMCAYTDVVTLLKNIVESVKPYAARRGLNMAFSCGMRVKVMNTDAEFVERIVINLLSNAIKHTKTGGTVCVACEDRKESIVISVQDNGEGIPDDKKQIIFDRFRQVNNTLARSSEGCGIGLSLCKSLAELLGGHIWVESREGCGSDFLVELPKTRIPRATLNIGVQSSTLQSRIMTEFSDISF